MTIRKCKYCGIMLIKSWQTKDRFFWIHNTTESKMLKRIGKVCKRPIPNSQSNEITDKGLKELIKKKDYLKRCSEDEDFRRKEINAQSSKEVKE